MGTESKLDRLLRDWGQPVGLWGIQSLPPDFRGGGQPSKDEEQENFALEWQVAERHAPAV
jgi:hypothetical protein